MANGGRRGWPFIEFMWIMRPKFLVVLLAALAARSQGDATRPALTSLAAHALEKVLEEVPEGPCRQQMALVAQGLRNVSSWAYSMVDATAKVPSGLLRGNLRALGDLDECVAVEAEVRGKYCLASLDFEADSEPVAHLVNVATAGRRHLEFRHRQIDLGNGQLEVAPGYTPQFSRWELGVCVPAACSAADVQALLGGAARRALAGTSLRAHVRVPARDCQTRGGHRRPLGAAHYAFLGFCGTFLVLVILGTVWNFHFDSRSPEDRSAAGAVLCAFSLCTGWQRLTSERSEELGCIAGLRALTTLIMIFLHELIYFTQEPAINKTFLMEMSSNIYYSHLATSWIIVEGLFTISGALYSYGVADTIITGRFNYAAVLIYRFIRLTPIYYIILWFYATFLEHLGEGPGWDTHINYNVQMCRKNWILNVFYVNNYINTMRMCMVQSWFLAADMQFFMLAPLVLIPLYRWRRGQTLVLVLIAFSVGLTAIAVFVTDVPGIYRVQDRDEEIVQYFINNHGKTHMHTSSYLVGLYLGYMLHHVRGKKMHMSKTLVTIGWMACGSMLAVATFWPHFMIQKNYQHNLVENAANPAISRLFWGTAVAWIIFACHTGYGGLLNRFLNCYAFRVLSRISYSTNMAHFILLLHNSGRRRVPLWFDLFSWIQAFFADYGIGTTLGLIVFLMFESPIYLVSRLYLLKGFSQKTLPPSVHKKSK